MRSRRRDRAPVSAPAAAATCWGAPVGVRTSTTVEIDPRSQRCRGASNAGQPYADSACDAALESLRSREIGKGYDEVVFGLLDSNACSAMNKPLDGYVYTVESCAKPTAS